MTIMADCDETLREMETFLDGELTDDAVTAMRAHLQGCTDCYQAFDFHAELKAVIAEKCRRDRMPAGLLARIEECLQTDLDDDGRIG
jgi:mycothiol system anti-sigma-R factor